MWWKRRLRQREVRSRGCGGGWSQEPSSARAARDPGDSGMEGSLPRPPIPRVPASDPPSRPLGAAPARLTSLRAWLPPRPLPTAPPEVRGACAPTRPSDRELGQGAGSPFSPEGGGKATPLSLGTGLASLWPVVFLTKREVVGSGECVFPLSLYVPSPHPLFTLLSLPPRVLGANDPFFFIPLPRGCLFFFFLPRIHLLGGRLFISVCIERIILLGGRSDELPEWRRNNK